MIFENDQLSLSQVRKKIMIIKLLTTPAAIAIGLGLYGAFAAKGNAFHPLLNNLDFSYALIGIGLVAELISVVKLIPLFKLQSKLAPSNNQT